MAEIRWTEEQKKAIEAEGTNILVSAAAGSGKTAVLVERVIRMLTRKDDPADLDELLIMTFTNAATAQMKEKIYRAIRKKLEDDPANAHLRLQLLKVNNARIYTIDALCLRIVRDNFQDVDIDPGFRIADSAEASMLREDVLKDLIEAHYSDPEPGFLEFAESYTDKSDAKIESIVNTLYGFAVSHPEPEEWIKNSVAPYLINARPGSIDPWAAKILGEPDEASSGRWMPVFRNYVLETAYSLVPLAEQVFKISEMNYGPYKYAEVAESVFELARNVTAEDSCFDYIRDSLAQFIARWKRFPVFSKKDEVDDTLKKQASDLAGEIRKTINELYDTFFGVSLIESMEKMGRCANVAAAIAALTIEFGKAFSEAKKERRIAEFNDVAHFALRVLIKKNEAGELLKDKNGCYVYSEVADRMAAGIREIIIDEYQDTNQLQECIAAALSSERFGRPDIFMVGDVKQSIYGFRMACPELFIAKSETYSKGTGGERIILDRNFRSRRQILDITNYIFNQVMVPEVGGIDYTNGNRLAYGAEDHYQEPDGPEIYRPEFIFVKGTGEDVRMAECYQIAMKIEEIAGSFPVTDGGSGEMRPARYSDICILTRNSSNNDLEQMLESRGIPFIRAASKGFFSSLEVRLTLNLLDIIDNPFQDIPFTAVITSPLVGVNANELAAIRISYQGESFSMFEACRLWCRENDQEALSAFLEKLEDYRQRALILSAPELLEYVSRDSGLYDIFIAMPQGDSRSANIDLLVTKAIAYSEGSYSGLFNFLRYMRMMEKSEIDFGSASYSSAGTDAVRIMTMHKSKGLEFPVVILAKCGGRYNNSDFTGSILMEKELGLGIELRDPEERTVDSTLPMETIRMERKRQLVAEEMRVLYVAMTRAMEKLIVTASDQFSKTWTGQMARMNLDTQEQIAENSIVSDKSYFALMARGLIRHRDAEDLNAFIGVERDGSNPLYEGNCSFICSVKEAEDAFEDRAVEIMDVVRLDSELKKELEALTESAETDVDMFACEYPFLWASETPVKVTATQLENHTAVRRREYTFGGSDPFSEKTGAEAAERDAVRMLYGAERGSAYHSFFEMLDLTAFKDEMNDEEKRSEIQGQLDTLSKAGRLTKDAAESIDPTLILKFINSDTGCRMRRAESEGKLHREQQFVMGIMENGEERLLQGIIDAYIKEDDRIVLVDYKTDRGKSREDFVTAYKGQQDAYRKALEAAWGLPVVAELLYLVESGETIDLTE